MLRLRWAFSEAMFVLMVCGMLWHSFEESG
jgi:hypothetical protein